MKRKRRRQRMPRGMGTVYEKKDKDRYGNYTKRAKPFFWYLNGKYMGSFATREDAELAARIYNRDHKESDDITFSQVWELWLEHDSCQINTKTVQEHRRKYECYCKPLYDIPYKDLKPKDLIDIMDGHNLKNGTKNNILKMFRALDRCAYKFELVDRKITDVIPYYKKDPSVKKKPFTEKEIKSLWKNLDIEDVDLILILLYTGLRSGELAELKIENIHDDHIIAGFKTEAGTDRYVPIHPKIKPLIKKRVSLAKKDTLLNYSAKQFRIRFKKALTKLNMVHIPHECRHTFITRLDNAGANRTCINLIVGHKGNGVGEQVYTHKTQQQLQETVLLLD